MVKVLSSLIIKNLLKISYLNILDTQNLILLLDKYIIF
jgi:hypothetical protein